jgi:hypothetical protein
MGNPGAEDLNYDRYRVNTMAYSTLCGGKQQQQHGLAVQTFFLEFAELGDGACGDGRSSFTAPDLDCVLQDAILIPLYHTL